MKFGKALAEATQAEWVRHTVPYKLLKKHIKSLVEAGSPDAKRLFLEEVTDSAQKASAFFVSRVENVEELFALVHTDSVAALAADKNDGCDLQMAVIACKKMRDLAKEIELVECFAELNVTALTKILKKFDKKASHSVREEQFATYSKELDLLSEVYQSRLASVKANAETLLVDVEALVMKFREATGSLHRKVYTIGTFDLLHRGHEQLLRSLRMFGDYVVVAIHDDESYFKLKKKWPMDNIQERCRKIKQFADMVFVIPDVDPTFWMQLMLSDEDIANKNCCYVRGDDMEQFPGREWIESQMPVFLTPRMPSVSSSEIRSEIPEAKDYVPEKYKDIASSMANDAVDYYAIQGAQKSTLAMNGSDSDYDGSTAPGISPTNSFNDLQATLVPC